MHIELASVLEQQPGRNEHAILCGTCHKTFHSTLLRSSCKIRLEVCIGRKTCKSSQSSVNLCVCVCVGNRFIAGDKLNKFVLCLKFGGSNCPAQLNAFDFSSRTTLSHVGGILTNFDRSAEKPACPSRRNGFCLAQPNYSATLFYMPCQACVFS